MMCFTKLMELKQKKSPSLCETTPDPSKNQRPSQEIKIIKCPLKDNADCWECCSSEGAHLHLHRERPMIQNYWLKLHKRIKKHFPDPL